MFSLRGVGKKEEVTMRIAELEARLLANAETQRNAQIAIERLTLALSEAQAAFEAEHPRLRAAIEPLVEAVKTAQTQVASSQAALETLQGVRAIDFLRRPLQTPFTRIQDTELKLQSPQDIGNLDFGDTSLVKHVTRKFRKPEGVAVN